MTSRDRVLALIVLLGLAASGTHGADSTVATGWIRGTVHCLSEVGVGAYANVVIPGTRLGARTDEKGTFYIREIPVGTHVVEVQQVGMDRKRVSVEVRPDRVTVVDINVCHSIELMVDSLNALGLWPPKLDQSLARAMRASTAIQAQRLGDSVTHGPPQIHISGVPKGSARDCRLAWRDTLVLALGKADFASPLRGIKHLCSCSPEVEVRLSGGTEEVQVRLCFFCGEAGIRTDARSQFAFFGEGSHGLVRFVHAIFFDDPELMKVVDHAYSTHGYR